MYFGIGLMSVSLMFHLKASLSPKIASNLQRAVLSKAVASNESSGSSSMSCGSSISPSNSRISSFPMSILLEGDRLGPQFFQRGLLAQAGPAVPLPGPPVHREEPAGRRIEVHADDLLDPAPTVFQDADGGGKPVLLRVLVRQPGDGKGQVGQVHDVAGARNLVSVRDGPPVRFAGVSDEVDMGCASLRKLRQAGREQAL